MDRASLISLLDEHGINPSTDGLDQHFIACPAAVQTVVQVADLSARDHVLEIGPGPGQLTREILKQGASVTAIELDTRFEPILSELERQSNGHLQIVWGSALNTAWPSEVNKLVMNPPYSILEALLERIHDARGITSVTMIIGKRYYLNAIAKIGDHDFTKTALMTQARFSPSLVQDLDKDCFYPEAGGKSVIMNLVCKNKPEPVLYRLADFFIVDPQVNVSFVVQQALEPLNKRARKYRDYDQFVTIGKLNLREEVLNKRLQDLSNYEIQQIVAKLSYYYNARFKKRSSHHSSEDDDLDE